MTSAAQFEIANLFQCVCFSRWVMAYEETPRMDCEVVTRVAHTRSFRFVICVRLETARISGTAFTHVIKCSQPH